MSFLGWTSPTFVLIVIVSIPNFFPSKSTDHPPVANPLDCPEHHVHDTHIFNLNKFIITINETAQQSFVVHREHEIDYEYHGSSDMDIMNIMGHQTWTLNQ